MRLRSEEGGGQREDDLQLFDESERLCDMVSYGLNIENDLEIQFRCYIFVLNKFSLCSVGLRNGF